MNSFKGCKIRKRIKKIKEKENTLLKKRESITPSRLNYFFTKINFPIESPRSQFYRLRYLKVVKRNHQRHHEQLPPYSKY